MIKLFKRFHLRCFWLVIVWFSLIFMTLTGYGLYQLGLFGVKFIGLRLKKGHVGSGSWKIQKVCSFWHGWVNYSVMSSGISLIFCIPLSSVLASLLGACFLVVARWPPVWQVYILSVQEPRGKESTPSELTHFSNKSWKKKEFSLASFKSHAIFYPTLWPWWFSILIGRP